MPYWYGRARGGPAPLAVALVVGALAMGCSPQPLTLRTDVTPLTPSQRLQGLRVAVVDVQDLRKEAKVLGAHRDGVARVTQHGYEPGNDPRLVTRRLLELMLLAAGAQLVHPQAAQLNIAVGIEKLEITTDAPLAGEETFGRVELVVSLTDGAGRPLGTGRFNQDIADEDHADRGLLGDGLRDALAQVVAALRPGQAIMAPGAPPGMMPPAGQLPPAGQMPPATGAAPPTPTMAPAPGAPPAGGAPGIPPTPSSVSTTAPPQPAPLVFPTDSGAGR